MRELVAVLGTDLVVVLPLLAKAVLDEIAELVLPAARPTVGKRGSQRLRTVLSFEQDDDVVDDGVSPVAGDEMRAVQPNRTSEEVSQRGKLVLVVRGAQLARHGLGPLGASCLMTILVPRCGVTRAAAG